MTESETKQKPQKRPETRMRDAVALGLKLTPSVAVEVRDGSGNADDAAIFASAEARAAGIMAEARARRDFAREIAGLDKAQRAMVRAGIEASRS